VLGECAFFTGTDEEALQSAVEENPENAALHYWLGRSFFELRDFSRSISSFERAIKLYPKRSDYHDWLGRACGRKAEESSHSNMPAALPLARRTHHEFETAVQLEKKDPALAEEDLRTYIDNVPENSEIPSHSSAHEWLGRLYEDEKKPDVAAEQYQAGLALDPQNKTARESLKKLQKR
jgi:TolA-binding protein